MVHGPVRAYPDTRDTRDLGTLSITVVLLSHRIIPGVVSSWDLLPFPEGFDIGWRRPECIERVYGSRLQCCLWKEKKAYMCHSPYCPYGCREPFTLGMCPSLDDCLHQYFTACMTPSGPPGGCPTTASPWYWK